MTSYRDDASGSLSEDDRRRLAELTERLRLAEATDPQSWALSEVSEDIAQLTRLLFLRGAWQGPHSSADDALGDDDARGDKVRRRDAASEDHLREFMERALGDLAFSLLYLIDFVEPDGNVRSGRHQSAGRYGH